MGRHKGSEVIRNEWGQLEPRDGNGDHIRFYMTVTLPDGKKKSRYVTDSPRNIEQRWLAWQQSKIDEFNKKKREAANLPPRDETKEAATMPVKEENVVVPQPLPPTLPEYVYVLRFTEGRKSKVISAYLCQDKALDMAKDLGDALKVAEIDGEYDVDVVELRA